MTFTTATPLVFCLLASALLSPIAHADEDSSAGSFSSPRFKFDGFGSLGIARSTNGEAEILRSLTPPEGITDHWSANSDSILGLQASYRISDEVETVAQAVSYLRDDGSFQPNITWAFLKYDVTPRFSMRFGRIGTIDLRTDYLSQGIGKKFTATGRVTRLGGRIASVQMTLENETGQLIATGCASYVVS